MGSAVMSDSRINKLEQDVAGLNANYHHQSKDIGEIKEILNDSNKQMILIREAISAMSTLIEQNQQLPDKLEAYRNEQNEKIASIRSDLSEIKKLKWMGIGGFSFVMFFVVYGERLKSFLM